MYSSHQTAAPISEPYPCPECGEVSVAQTVETCKLKDGLMVKKLRHFKCQSCYARFFDDEAMHHIQSQRAMQNSTAAPAR